VRTTMTIATITLAVALGLSPSAASATPRTFDMLRDAQGLTAQGVQGSEETTTVPVVAAVRRAAGEDRYQTAIAISELDFADGSAPNVVLVSGDSWADALSASALAGAVGGPLLLAAPSSLPSGLVQELGRLGCHTVYIVGGTNSVRTSVATALQTGGFTVERVAAGDRYATSAAVASKVKTLLGTAFPGTVFVARGDSFADALAASPVAYNKAFPVLLTTPGSLSSSASQALSSLAATRAVVCGGTDSVSPAAFAAIAALPSMTVTRVAGSDRYTTAIAIADHALSQGWANFAFVGIANGSSPYDALGGGAAAGAYGGVMLLVAANSIPVPTIHALDDHWESIFEVQLFGGRSIISDSVRSDVYDIVNP
jgi:putative cell wall-binding protein